MLLRSVASQAGVTLENLNLAENIAERLQAERAISQEMEIARQVQRKLFPQRVPNLKTLDTRVAVIRRAPSVETITTS